MSARSGRVLRGAAALAVLFVLVLIVRGWWADYRAADRSPSRSSESSPVVEATATPPATEGEGEQATQDETTTDNTVIVLIDGLNFRAQPKEDARALRGLDKGEALALLGQRDGWYEVKDENDVTGWVSSNPSYTRTERR